VEKKKAEKSCLLLSLGNPRGVKKKKQLTGKDVDKKKRGDGPPPNPKRGKGAETIVLQARKKRKMRRGENIQRGMTPLNPGSAPFDHGKREKRGRKKSERSRD